MRRLVPLVALIALLVAACGGETASQLEGTSWTFFAYDTGDGAVDVLPGTQPTLAFDGSTVSGSDGCNDFTGPYEISSGNMIDIGTLAITTKSCEPEVEAQSDVILMVLDEAILYEKSSDDELFMRNETADFLGYNRVSDE